MNPYIHRGMITDPTAFFGRKTELKDIFALLERPSSINIVGNRRVGKSSLLAHLCRQSVYQTYLSKPEQYIFVFLDLQELAELNQERFFATIINRATQASGGAISTDGADETDYRTFRQFIRQYCQPAGQWKLVCCFDEFEQMSENPHFDLRFYQALRSLAQQYMIGYVVSSRIGINELRHEREIIEGSQFWNIFTLEPLRLLAPDEAKALVTLPFAQAGLPLSAEDETFVHSLAGRFAFFMQIVCFHLFAIRQTKAELSPLDYRDIRDRYMTEVAFHFAYMWEQLDDERRAYLRALVQNATATASERVIRELMNQSVLAQNGEEVCLFAQAFGTFVQDHTAYEQAIRQIPEGQLPTAAHPQPTSALSQSGPSLSICLWGERSAVVELAAPRRFYTVCPTVSQFDPRTVEDLRRQAQQISTDATHWRENLRRLGSTLFRQIIVDNPKINGAFAAGMAQADRRERPLEIVFRTPREMLGLPLELLYADDFVSGEEGPLCLMHPLVRYVTDAYFERPALKIPISAERGLRVLLLAGADGGRVTPLNLEAELRSLTETLANQAMIERVDVVRSGSQTFEVIQKLLSEANYDIIHYAGHAIYDERDPETSGLIFFKDEAKNDVVTLTANSLQDLLRSSSASLFFLNACSTARTGDLFHTLDHDYIGLLDALVVARIPTIVGLRWPIFDESAVRLAQVFYASLLETGSPSRALWLARRALARDNRNDPAWASPVLIMQEGR